MPYPPTGGARVRAFHAIQHLAQANAVTVAAPARDDTDLANAESLKMHCADVMTERVTPLAATVRAGLGLAGLRSASVGYFRAPRLEARLRQALSNGAFDLVVVHCGSVAPYVVDAPVPKLLDFVDVDSQKWRAYRPFTWPPKAWLYGIEGWQLARIERDLARRYDACICATDDEARTLTRLSGVAAEIVVNGVDLAHFAPPGHSDYDPDRICFLGRMDYYPNEQAMRAFCRDVLPRLRHRRPETTLSIVGANPTAGVRALAGQEGVEVTGTVDDVRPYLHRAACTVAPLQIARGTQNKILESLAAGVPAVASSMAACGTDTVDGEHLMVADDPDDIAAAIHRLQTDPATRSRLARSGRARVESRHAWPSAMAELDRRLARLARSAQSTSAGPGAADGRHSRGAG
jgi:hypothetical protein